MTTLTDRKMCSGCMDLIGLTKTRYDCKLGVTKSKCPGHTSDWDGEKDDRKCKCCQICRNARTRLRGKLSNMSLGIEDKDAKADQCCKCGRELRYSYHKGMDNFLTETSLDRLHKLVDDDDDDRLNLATFFNVIARHPTWRPVI